MVNNPKNFKIDTAHNSIEMCYTEERLELRSHDNALQSVINLENRHSLGLKNLEYLMSVLLFIPPPREVLMLGTAAGSLLHFLHHYFPETKVTTVDIDADLIGQLLQMEVLPAANAKLDYIHADAKEFIAQCGQSFDLVLVDIFDGAQSPAWLLEKNTTNNLFRLLTRRGALVYNLLIESEHDFKRFYRDLRLVFDQQTLCLPVQGLENTIAYGIRSPPPPLDMTQHMKLAVELSERLEIDFMRILAVIYNTNPVGRGVI